MKSALAIVAVLITSGLAMTIPEVKKPSEITRYTEPKVLTSQEVLESTTFYKEQHKDSILK